MRVMLPDGTVRNVSRTEDARLFDLVVGGYGLFGVILDVDLESFPTLSTGLNARGRGLPGLRADAGPRSSPIRATA